MKLVAKSNIENLSSYGIKVPPPTLLITRKAHKSLINYWGKATIDVRVLMWLKHRALLYVWILHIIKSNYLINAEYT